MYVYVQRAGLGPVEARRGCWMPWDWSYRLWPACGCWELNFCPLEERPVLLTTEQPLWLIYYYPKKLLPTSEDRMVGKTSGRDIDVLSKF